MAGTLVVVPCGGQKIWSKEPNRGPVPARDACTSGFFRSHRSYAEKFGDAWVILSAKDGFISPDFQIPEPYNVTFKEKSSHPIAENTLRSQAHDLGLDRFSRVIGLGGKDYRRAIEAAFAGTGVRLEFPFSDLKGMGYMMQAVQAAVRSGRSGTS